MHISERNVNVYLHFLFMFSSVFRNGFELIAGLLVMMVDLKHKEPFACGIVEETSQCKAIERDSVPDVRARSGDCQIDERPAWISLNIFHDILSARSQWGQRCVWLRK